MTSSASPQTLRDGIAVPTFPLSLAWPASTGSLRIPEWVCCPFGHAASAAASFRRCRCRTCSQSTQHIPPASTVSLRRAGLWFLCSFQCSCLASNEPHRTLEDSIGLAFSHWRHLQNGLASFLAGLSDFPCQRFNRWLSVTPERDSVVSKLIKESRCSPCDPGELCSLSRNQHCPRHLVSPFADDQNGRHVHFRFPLTKKPVVHRHVRHSVRVFLSIRPPARCAHASSHHTELAPGSVRSMCGHALLVFVGSRLTWVANVPHLCTPVVKSRLSIIHVFIVLVTCRILHTVTFTLFSTALIQLRSYGSSSLGPVFHAHSSCRRKGGLLQLNVTRFPRSLPSAT